MCVLNTKKKLLKMVSSIAQSFHAYFTCTMYLLSFLGLQGKIKSSMVLYKILRKLW